MKQKRSAVLPAVFASLAFAALILDSRTATSGAAAAVTMCIQVLIPTLFPFFVVSCMLTSLLGGMHTRLLRPLTKLLRLDNSAQPLLLLGCLGGYPIGAVCIAQAHENGLPRADARRMMAFCSNAGPAFLFGMGSRIFDDTGVCRIAWAIHLLSAAAVGILTPGHCTGRFFVRSDSVRLPQALTKSMHLLAGVCGWVVLFRVLLAFAQRWFPPLLPISLQIAFTGALELASGAAALTQLTCDGAKLTAFSAMLAFGGLCVWLQTRSAAQNVDTSLYLPGKITQCAFSVLFSTVAQFLLAGSARSFCSPPILVLCCCVCIAYPFFLRIYEKKSSKSAASVV